MELITEEGYRLDGRRANQLRDIHANLGVYTQADGSAALHQGGTFVLCAVYGPHECRVKSRATDDKAQINAQYSMATFSTIDRKSRQRGDRKSQDYRILLQRAFESVVFTENYPRAQIDIFCEVVQADGGELACCINAASLALADAGVASRGLLTATTVRLCKRADKNATQLVPMVDLCQAEMGGNASAYLVAAMLPLQDNFVLAELEGRLHADSLDIVLDAASAGCGRLHHRLRALVADHVSQCCAQMGQAEKLAECQPCDDEPVAVVCENYDATVDDDSAEVDE